MKAADGQSARISAVYHLLTLSGWGRGVTGGAVMVALSEQGSWDLPLVRPIEIEHGDQRLATLGEVGAYILALPETVQRQELWCAAAETVLEAAKSGRTARVALVSRLASIISGQNARILCDETTAAAASGHWDDGPGARDRRTPAAEGVGARKAL